MAWSRITRRDEWAAATFAPSHSSLLWWRCATKRNQRGNADILHAYRNAISSRPLEDGKVMLVGPARNAGFYELGVRYDADTDSVVIFHAMLARSRFLR